MSAQLLPDGSIFSEQSAGAYLLPSGGTFIDQTVSSFESELSLLNISGLSAGAGLGNDELDAIFVGKIKRV